MIRRPLERHRSTRLRPPRPGSQRGPLLRGAQVSSPVRRGSLLGSLLLLAVLLLLPGDGRASATVPSEPPPATPSPQQVVDDEEPTPFTEPQDPTSEEEPARQSDEGVDGAGEDTEGTQEDEDAEDVGEEDGGDPGDDTRSPEDEDESRDDEAPAPTVSTPAVRASTIPLSSIILAAGVLLLGAIALRRVLVRRPAGTPLQAAPAAPAGPAAPHVPETPLATGEVPGLPQQVDRRALDLLLECGRALIDSGDAVSHVEEVLRRIAEVNGAAHVGIIVLPTALIVSIPGGERVETEVAPAGSQRLRLDQVEEVVRVVTAAEEGRLGPMEGIAAIDAARRMPPPSSDRIRIWGYVLFSVGLAMILRGGLLEMLVAAGIGLAIGAVKLRTERWRASYQGFVPLVAAFLAAVMVFTLGRLLTDLAVFPPLVAPLIAFLPGAVLTTAVFELSTGHVISGSSRLAAGVLRLVLLALGIVAGAELVGVPAAQVSELQGGAAGVIEPWVGVAVFGIGVVVHNGVRRASLPWILLVLFFAYAGQVLGGLFFGTTLSAFFGALVMTPVAMIAAKQPSGPPALVTFLPGFWLLVPGALGLAGITSILDEDRVEGIASLTSMGTSMIGIALGVLLGIAVGSELATRLSMLPAKRATAAAG